MQYYVLGFGCALVVLSLVLPSDVAKPGSRVTLRMAVKLLTTHPARSGGSGSSGSSGGSLAHSRGGGSARGDHGARVRVVPGGGGGAAARPAPAPT